MRRIARLSSLVFLGVALPIFFAGCGGGSSSTGTGGGGGTSTVSVAVFPGTATIPLSTANTPSTITFTAVVLNSMNQAVTFSASGGGSFSGNVFTAPTAPATVTITATSQADMTKNAMVTVTVTAATPITVTPTAIAIPAGGMQKFTATQNGNVVAAAWTLAGAPGADLGIIDVNGNYTAPPSPPKGGAVSIIATFGGAGLATVSVVFSNASLKGQFTFAFSGQEMGGFHAVAGTFTADGAGDIVTGLEDDNNAKTVSMFKFTGGTYLVEPDGRTQVQVNTSTGTPPNTVSGTAQFEITLISNTQALIVRFDTTATGSGTVNLATPAEFSNTAVSGFYSFELAGVDSKGSTEVIGGNFFSDVNGTFPLDSCIQDVNDAGTVTQGDLTLQGNIVATVDPNTGRGTLLVNSTPTGIINFAFYVVDNTHFKLVETDTVPVLAGDAFKASSPVTELSLNGGFAFTVGGAVNNTPYAAGGVFVSSGTGSISSGEQDENQGGSIRLLETFQGSSYSISPANSNRILLTLAVGGNSVEYGVYPASNGTAVMVSLATNFVDNGLAFHQSSQTTLQGNYAINFTGVGTDGDQDLNGAIATPSALVLTGYLDINNNGTLSTSVPLSNSTFVAADASGRGTITLQTASPSPATFLLAYYVVNSSMVLGIEVDHSRTAVVLMPNQF